MPKFLPNSSLYPPSYVPFPCAPRSFSLFFLSLSHSFFFSSIVCQPTCLHGNSVWKGCCSYDLSDLVELCHFSHTFLRFCFSTGSYCELDYKMFSSRGFFCLKWFVSCSVYFVICNSSCNLFKEVHPKMFVILSYELFGNRNTEISNSKVEFKMHCKAVRHFTRVSTVPENMSRYVDSACFITWCG